MHYFEATYQVDLFMPHEVSELLSEHFVSLKKKKPEPSGGDFLPHRHLVILFFLCILKPKLKVKNSHGNYRLFFHLHSYHSMPVALAVQDLLYLK